MAATTIDMSGELFVTAVSTMEATAGNARQITITNGPARKVFIFFRTAAGADEEGRIAHTGTDAAALDAGAFPVPSGQGLNFTIYRQEDNQKVALPVTTLDQNLYVGVPSTGSASGTCHIFLVR